MNLKTSLVTVNSFKCPNKVNANRFSSEFYTENNYYMFKKKSNWQKK